MYFFVSKWILRHKKNIVVVCVARSACAFIDGYYEKEMLPANKGKGKRRHMARMKCGLLHLNITIIAAAGKYMYHKKYLEKNSVPPSS